MNLANDVSKCNKAAGVFNGPLWKYIKPPFFNLFSAKDTGHHQLASWRRAVSFLLVIFLLLKTTSSTKNWKKKKIEKKGKGNLFCWKKPYSLLLVYYYCTNYYVSLTHITTMERTTDQKTGHHSQQRQW